MFQAGGMRGLHQHRIAGGKRALQGGKRRGGIVHQLHGSGRQTRLAGGLGNQAGVRTHAHQAVHAAVRSMAAHPGMPSSE